MPISGKIGAAYRTDGLASVAFTVEATTGNATYTRYAITNAAKRFWDDTVVPVVKKNGTVVSSGFSIEYAGGVVVFNPAILNTDVIIVGGNYFNIVQCATFFNWKLDIDQDLKEVTTFASNGWKEQLATVKGWNASADGYWADGTFAGLLGKNIILSLYVDYSGNKRYEGYVYIKKNSITEPVDDVVKENVDITGDGALYYHDV
jgi:hypothetical protein